MPSHPGTTSAQARSFARSVLIRTSKMLGLVIRRDSFRVKPPKILPCESVRPRTRVCKNCPPLQETHLSDIVGESERTDRTNLGLRFSSGRMQL
jgi:hypothetical protein